MGLSRTDHDTEESRTTPAHQNERPGHPGPGGKQTGTKDNAREELAYLQDLSAAVKQAVSEGKSYADAQKEIKLPKYEAWPNYNAFLPMNIERYYDFWNRGI